MIAATAFIVGAMVVGGGTIAHADSVPTTTPVMSALVSALAQRFNLSTTDIQSVVDQVMAQQRTTQAQRAQQTFSDRVAKAVSAGTITQAQATLIIAEEQSIQQTLSGLAGETTSARQTALTSLKQSVQEWATTNNIPQSVVARFLSVGPRGPHFRGGLGHPLTSSTS